jgi:hypothetical protein
MERINLDNLRTAIRSMKRYSLIYKLLKEELSKLGYWKNRQRGDPQKAYRVSREKKAGNNNANPIY